MQPTTTHDPTASRTRWGGALLAVGLLLSLVSFSLILALGAPPDDMARRAERVVENAATFRTSGYLGLFGNALLCLGALFLSTRPMALRRPMPASAFWLFFAFGALLFVGLDAFKASALVPLATAYASNADVYAAVDAFRAVVIALGTIIMGAGATLLFWTESAAVRSSVPQAIAWIGAVGGVLVALGGVGSLAGVEELQMAGLAAYVVFVALLLLSFRVAMPAPDAAAQPATRIVKA